MNNTLYFTISFFNSYVIGSYRQIESLDGTRIRFYCLDDAERFLRRLNPDDQRKLTLWCAPYRGATSYCPISDAARLLWKNTQISIKKLKNHKAEEATKFKHIPYNNKARIEQTEYIHIPEQHLRYIPPPSSPKSPPPSIKSMDDVRSLDDAQKLLKQRREEIKESGYKQKYSDNELRAIAQKGELKDRFLVRLIFGDEQSARDKTLGFERDSGRAPYWATTLDMTEAADCDPEIIAGLFGIENFDLNQAFTLAIIDMEKMPKQSERESFIPTFDKMRTFGSKEFGEDEGFNETTMSVIMNEDFAKSYENLINEYSDTGQSMYATNKVLAFAQIQGKSSNERRQIKARHTMQLEFGANPLFSGNGMTRITPNSHYAKDIDQEYGVVETFTFERDPLSLADLESKGAVKLIPATPTRKT